MRSNFAAFLKILMGETHVAKFIIRNGVGPKHDVFSLEEFINKLIQERTKQKEKERVAPEHASELRKAAQFARHQLRGGRRLAKKPYWELSTKNQALVDKYNDGILGQETPLPTRRNFWGALLPQSRPRSQIVGACLDKTIHMQGGPTSDAVNSGC